MCWRSPLFSVVIRSFVSCQRHHQCTARNYKTFVHFKNEKKKWYEIQFLCVIREILSLHYFLKEFHQIMSGRSNIPHSFCLFPIIYLPHILNVYQNIISHQILATPLILTRKMTCHAPSLFNTPLVSAPCDSYVMNT